MDLSRCPQLLCSSPSCLSSRFFCIDGARFPNDGIHQNSRMLPLCSSRIITEEGPVLLAVSLNCCFGKVLRGDQGDFCHPQVTARWTVPSRMYHGWLFCLKFILHLWGLCFMSDPLVCPGMGPSTHRHARAPRLGPLCHPAVGAPAPHERILAHLFCHSLYSAVMSFHGVLLPLPIYSDLFISGLNFFFNQLCIRHCFNLPLKAGPFCPLNSFFHSTQNSLFINEVPQTK